EATPTVSGRVLWNGMVMTDIAEMAGFKRILHYTLHRPRDILLLLNRAKYDTERAGNERIGAGNVENAAKGISQGRLDDVQREYSQVVPCLPALISCLVEGPKVWQRHELLSAIDAKKRQDDLTPLVLQDLRIRTTSECLRIMYETALVGALDAT